MRNRKYFKCISALLAASLCGPALFGCAQTGEEGFDVRVDNNTDDTEKTVTVTKLDSDEDKMKETTNITSSVMYMNGDFELPLDGAMGIAVSKLDIHNAAGDTIGTMVAGTEFTILAESETDLRVKLSDDKTGVTLNEAPEDDIVYIDKDFVMINLPDVIPSIVYDNTNSYSSLLSSKGYSIDGLTGTALYNSKYYNERLGEDQYVLPVLYCTAKKLKNVQEQMLADGNSLKIYESYRPFETQQTIIARLTDAMETNEEINETITGAPWGKSWFIALKRSNHQRGCAIDTTMVKVTGTEQKKAGVYAYEKVTSYEEYEMPTAIHDMSADSIALTNPVESMDREAWKTDPIAPTMTEAAIKLQNYMTANELYPLASEWWHFNDIDSRENSDDNSGAGDFYITACTSKAPEEASVSGNKDTDEEHDFGGTDEESPGAAETSGSGGELVSSSEGAGVDSTESIVIERAESGSTDEGAVTETESE